MRNDKILEFLRGILGPYKEYAKSEYYFICPLCPKRDNKKKLAINLSENTERYMHWHCWRDDSHSGESIYSLLKKIHASPEQFADLQSISGYRRYVKTEELTDGLFDNRADSDVETAELPKEFKSFLPKSNHPEYKNALLYLVRRGLSPFDIIKYNAGYCDSGKYAGYVIFPSYDEEFRLNYFVARSYYDSDFRYKNPDVSKNVVFNEIHINWSEPIILVEGVFDAIAVKRNAIPVLGKTINDALRLKILEKHTKDVYICFDNDAMKNSADAINEFMKNGVNVYFIKLTDKDPSVLGFLEMRRLIKEAMPMDFSALINMKLSL